MYKVVLSRSFGKELEKKVKNDPKLWARVTKTLILLSRNLKHPSLRLHKLSGRDNWSVSVSESYRIIFNIEGGNLYCTKFGTHEQVY